MIADRFSSQGVDFVAINSNSKNTYAEDDFEGMIDRMDQYSFLGCICMMSLKILLCLMVR